MCCIAKEGTHTYNHDEVLGYNLPFLDIQEAMETASLAIIPSGECNDLNWIESTDGEGTTFYDARRNGYIARVWEIYPLIEG